MFTAAARRLRALVRADEADFRAQLIAVVALVGIPVSWASAIINVFVGSPTWTVVLNAVAGFLVLGLWLWGRRSGRYREAYLAAVGTLFVVLFPALYFAGGGLESGMPVFFMFALVFTAIMLDGVALRALIAVEAVVFAAAIAVSFAFPQTVTPPASRLSWVIDVGYSVLGTGLALVVALRLFIGIYERNKAQLVQRNAELAAVDAARVEFLAMVAHELNTPLMVIQAHAEESRRSLAASPTTDTQDLANLTVIDTEAVRLGRLVSQLLDLARINAGGLELQRSEGNLDTIVQQTLQMYRPVWNQYGNTVRVRRGSAAPRVYLDRERVVQVLVNLLSNAARHTHDGTITVGVRVVDGYAELTVADDGEGIDPQVLAQLGAHPIRGRGEGVGSSRDAGLGVGLVITRHIVEAHDGELVVASQLGAGTTVTCRFPVLDDQPG